MLCVALSRLIWAEESSERGHKDEIDQSMAGLRNDVVE